MKLSVLASLVPGAGTQSSARSPLEGSAGRDFGALLGGMAKDTPTGTNPAVALGVPPVAEPTRSARASVAGALVPGKGEEGETGSQQESSSSAEREPQLSDVSLAAAPPVAGVGGVPGVTSLLSLAARAAEPARSGAAQPSTASDPAVVPTVASEAKSSSSASSAQDQAQASGHVDRKASKADHDDDRAGGVADTAAPTPVGALVAATGVPALATVPNAADVTQPSSGTDALAAAPPSSPQARTRSVMPSDGVALPSADDASGASPSFPTIAAPTAAAGEIGNASVPSTATGPVDAAILPGTVSVESYLGFDRSASVRGTEAQPASATDVSATIGASDPNDAEGLLTSAMSHAPTLVPVRSGSDADVAGASPSRPASTGEIAWSQGSDQSVAPFTAVLAQREGAAAGAAGAGPTGSTDATASSSASRATSFAVPLVPAADGAAAVADPSGLPPALPVSTSSRAMAFTAPLAPDAKGAAAGEAASSAPSSASIEISASDNAQHLVPTSTKPTEDQPDPPVADATASAPTTPAVAIVMPTPQAAPPVTQQVADGVAGLAATVVPDEAGPDTKVAPARTMALQLSPAGLGTLTVRLHVAGRALDVQLEASDGRTAALIDRDRDVLSGALRGKDYQLQTLTVTTHDATMPGGTHAEHGTEPRSADTGSSDAGSPGRSRDESAGGRSGGDGSSREAPGREPRPTRRPADEASLERGSSSLFV